MRAVDIQSRWYLMWTCAHCLSPLEMLPLQLLHVLFTLHWFLTGYYSCMGETQSCEWGQGQPKDTVLTQRFEKVSVTAKSSVPCLCSRKSECNPNHHSKLPIHFPLQRVLFILVGSFWNPPFLICPNVALLETFLHSHNHCGRDGSI